MNNKPDRQLNRNGDRRGMSLNSQRNLKPNRNGRLPAKLSLTSLTKRELARIPTIESDGFDGKGESNAYWIARNAVRDARSGDKYARTEVWERTEGKVTQPIGGKDGEPIKTEIIVSNDTAKQLTKAILNGEGT